MKAEDKLKFNIQAFLAKAGAGRSISHHARSEMIFSQAEPADALFYIQKGNVKLTAVSQQGKHAVIAILKTGDFFGEGCLAGQPVRVSSATALSDCWLVRLQKAAAMAVIRNEPAFSQVFLHHLLMRNISIQEDLARRLFNSTEKKLARALLLAANLGKKGGSGVVQKPSLEALAEMVGTNRARVRSFMHRFRKMGFISGKSGLKLNYSLLSVLLRD